MPQPKKTASHLKLVGTFRPDRHKQPLPVQPIDPAPPAHLDAAEQGAWRELVTAGHEFLAQSDRLVVEVAARLLTRVRTGDAKAADYAQLQNLLGRMGLTPAGRRGLEPIRPADADGNPFDEIDSDDRFFRKPQ